MKSNYKQLIGVLFTGCGIIIMMLVIENLNLNKKILYNQTTKKKSNLDTIIKFVDIRDKKNNITENNQSTTKKTYRTPTKTVKQMSPITEREATETKSADDI